ncbi:MAG TPA: hypothetical protein VFM25_13650 [Verrucomicrobiae bacterium]|nr:hypothetical protein [Verrucomicrobiae bacterium]
MFTVFGAILAVFGLTSGSSDIYQAHSLGININLIWGIVLLVFGLFMLALAVRASKKPGPPKK